jgi:hypothetical protein
LSSPRVNSSVFITSMTLNIRASCSVTDNSMVEPIVLYHLDAGQESGGVI